MTGVAVRAVSRSVKRASRWASYTVIGILVSVPAGMEGFEARGALYGCVNMRSSATASGANFPAVHRTRS